MAFAGIVSVIARPGVGGWICDRRRIETLRQKAAGNQQDQGEHEKMKSFMKMIYGSQSDSLLAQGLQVRHQVVNVVVGVLSAELDMSFGRRMDRVLDRLAGQD